MRSKETQKLSMFQRTIVIAYLIFLPFNIWAISDLNNAYPKPTLQPNEVVSLQLLAMQKNEPICVSFTVKDVQ